MGVDAAPDLTISLQEFAAELIQDVRDLRAGKITPRDARVRAALAREALRAVHLQFEGMRWIEQRAKPISEAGAVDAPQIEGPRQNRRRRP